MRKHGRRRSRSRSRGAVPRARGGPESRVAGSLQKRGPAHGEVKAEAGAALPPAEGRPRRPAHRKLGDRPHTDAPSGRQQDPARRRPDLELAACRPVWKPRPCLQQRNAAPGIMRNYIIQTFKWSMREACRRGREPSPASQGGGRHPVQSTLPYIELKAAPPPPSSAPIDLMSHWP